MVYWARGSGLSRTGGPATDQNADDIVGGNNATLNNGATYAAGEVGQAFFLNRTNSQYVSAPRLCSLHLYEPDDGTMG